MLPDFRLRQREYLLRISQAMSAKLDLDVLLKLILESAVDLIMGKAGLIVLRQENGELLPRASFGLPAEAVSLFDPLWRDISPDDSSVPSDITLRLVIASRATGMPLRQVVSLPLAVEGENQGFIYIFRARGSESFTANDQQVLSTFATQAAIAVHNANLYRRVTAEQTRLHAIIENSGDGIMIINPFRIIRTWNKALVQLTGITAEEAVGRPCYDILNLKTRDGASICHTQCPILHPPENGQLYIEGFHQRSDGVKIAFADNYSQQTNNNHQAYQYIANIRDVTKLREADDLKQTLLAVISHELKTPVSIIKGYAGTLAREDANWDKATLAEGLGVIEEEADKLNALITNFLDASRLQAGVLQLHMSELYIPEIAQQAIDTLQATTDKHKFVIEFPTDYPTISGDHDRMSQVLTNLISNAIKYSPDGGLIQIGGDILSETIRLYVADDGIGIPEAEHERIFERFHRVDNSLARKTPGTGLGLFLVRSVIEAHGGTVRVESRPGSGSCFWIELPK
ncbi:MAG: ATP-binding protein [Chloroflexota bacterium]